MWCPLTDPLLKTCLLFSPTITLHVKGHIYDMHDAIRLGQRKDVAVKQSPTGQNKFP